MNKPPRASSYAESQIGIKIVYMDKVSGESTPGTVVEVRRTGTQIVDRKTGEEWNGIQFLIRKENGRTFWTDTFADREPSKAKVK